MEGLKATEISKRLNLPIKEVRKMILPIDSRGVEMVRRAMELRGAGVRIVDIAKELGVYRGTVNRWLGRRQCLTVDFISMEEKDWLECEAIAQELGIHIKKN